MDQDSQEPTADTRSQIQDIKDPKDRPAEGIYKQLLIRIARGCRILRMVLQKIHYYNH